MAWTSTNPVAIGDPTKKSHYDTLWDNALVGRNATTGEVITAGTTGDGFAVTGALIIEAAPATPVANTLYKDNIVKAWVRFDIFGSIDDDYNVSSITDTGVGDFTVNWDLDFANTNYATVATPFHAAAAMATVSTIAVGSQQVLIWDSAGNAVDPVNINLNPSFSTYRFLSVIIYYTLDDIQRFCFII